MPPRKASFAQETQREGVLCSEPDLVLDLKPLPRSLPCFSIIALAPDERCRSLGRRRAGKDRNTAQRHRERALPDFSCVAQRLRDV